jgi:hypothetical protein
VLDQLHPDVFDAASRGLESDARFRSEFQRVQTPDGVRFYLRRASADLLGDLPLQGATGSP